VVAKFNTTDHTGVMVPVFAFGPGAELFQGVQENTDLFTKMMKLFGIPHI
jgi:alkaline phosphatase